MTDDEMFFTVAKQVQIRKDWKRTTINNILKRWVQHISRFITGT